MKKTVYRILNYIRYTLCGSCVRGIEWEEDGTYTICYCSVSGYPNLIRQFIKRKTRRKDEPIF